MMIKRKEQEEVDNQIVCVINLIKELEGKQKL